MIRFENSVKKFYAQTFFLEPPSPFHLTLTASIQTNKQNKTGFSTHCSIKFIVFTYDFFEAWIIVLILSRPSVYDVPYHQAGLIKEIEEINECSQINNCVCPKSVTLKLSYFLAARAAQ